MFKVWAKPFWVMKYYIKCKVKLYMYFNIVPYIRFTIILCYLRIEGFMKYFYQYLHYSITFHEKMVFHIRTR